MDIAKDIVVGNKYWVQFKNEKGEWRIEEGEVVKLGRKCKSTHNQVKTETEPSWWIPENNFFPFTDQGKKDCELDLAREIKRLEIWSAYEKYCNTWAIINILNEYANLGGYLSKVEFSTFKYICEFFDEPYKKALLKTSQNEFVKKLETKIAEKQGKNIRNSLIKEVEAYEALFPEDIREFIDPYLDENGKDPLKFDEDHKKYLEVYYKKSVVKDMVPKQKHNIIKKTVKKSDSKKKKAA